MVEKSKKRITSELLKNFLYTTVGIILMNLVLQIVIYPSLNHRLGQENLGVLLYLLSFVNILSPSFGIAVKDFRVVSWRKGNYKNGDYNLPLLLLSAAAIVITTAIAWNSIKGIFSLLLISILLLLTTVRYYSDVEFRVNLTFKKYLYFYSFLSAGYLIGYGLYILSDNWYLIFLVGEAAAIIFVWVKGRIFQPFCQRGKNLLLVARSSTVLAMSYLMNNLSLQLDRIILKMFVSYSAVSEYYVVSLIGKSLVFLVSPINALILSYLSKDEKRIDRKTFWIFIGLILAGSVLFLGACQVVVPVFIKLLYNDMYDQVKDLIFVANLAQILSIASTSIFAIVLTFAHERWQLILQTVHIIFFISLAIPLTKINGIHGFANAALISNGLRILSVVLVGTILVTKKSIPGQ